MKTMADWMAEGKEPEILFWVGSAGRLGVSPNEIKDGHNIRSDSREGDAANSADDHLGFRIAISYVSR